MFFWSILSYLFVSNFILEATEVIGSSMEPTLWEGDRFIINRLVYRFREPRRGEIVAIRFPGDSDVSVKRIVGLPEESVLIREGHVYVDNRQLAEDYLAVRTYTLPERMPTNRYLVATDAYFVMGDNRRVSYDSRYTGAVPKSLILGRIRKH
jgi:signal peptidase I